MITDINQLDLSKHYTYQDYLTWQFKERVELLKGIIFKMSPAPNLRHQDIVGEFYFQFRQYLKGKKCRVFIAPFDVRLPVSRNGKTDTVVQPDICVVCDESKLEPQGCNGAPDLVVEILSPGNTKKEMKGKLELYQESKVQEYWVIDPEREFGLIYSLNETSNYLSSLPYTSGDFMKSSAITGFEFDLNLIFEDKEG